MDGLLIEKFNGENIDRQHPRPPVAISYTTGDY